MIASTFLIKPLLAFAELAINPDDDAETRWKKQVLSLSALLIPILLLVIGILYLLFNEAVAGFIYASFAVYIWANLAIFIRVHRNPYFLFWAISVTALLLHLIVALNLGSFVNSGAIVMWGFAFPVVYGLLFIPVRQVLPLFGLFIINIIIQAILQTQLRQSINLPPNIIAIIFMLNIITPSFVILLIIGYFIHQRDIAFKLLKGEQVKAENLLLNILPSEIADILKNENRVIADHFDNASILFADVVNFTPLSASMSAVQLVELLNEIFSYFDLLVEKYDLEKIKTIGDCYMVASGVPRPRPDHAQALISMGLEMINYVTHHSFQGRQITFRIGINSGAVVAGVIGRKKFIYDLWGDAVNTASRMESHGSVGTIQITDATYDLIKNEFECESRGVVNIKGKGEMAVWTVLREKVPAAP